MTFENAVTAVLIIIAAVINYLKAHYVRTHIEKKVGSVEVKLETINGHLVEIAALKAEIATLKEVAARMTKSPTQESGGT